MTSAVLGLGTTLGVGSGASPQVYTTIAEVLSITGPNLTAEDVDVTNLDSTAKEYISGVPDGGSVDFECNWTSSTQQQQVRDDVEAGTTRYYEVAFSTSPNTVATFQARATSFAMSTDPNSQLRASVTLKITGSVSWVN
jgi:hypothetical protein